MALYRQLQLSFWRDAFVMDLTPEEKFFYVYLLQCSNTKQCGIFELPKRAIEYPMEEIFKDVHGFQEKLRDGDTEDGLMEVLDKLEKRYKNGG